MKAKRPVQPRSNWWKELAARLTAEAKRKRREWLTDHTTRLHQLEFAEQERR